MQPTALVSSHNIIRPETAAVLPRRSSASSMVPAPSPAPAVPPRPENDQSRTLLRLSGIMIFYFLMVTILQLFGSTAALLCFWTSFAVCFCYFFRKQPCFRGLPPGGALETPSPPAPPADPVSPAARRREIEESLRTEVVAASSFDSAASDDDRGSCDICLAPYEPGDELCFAVNRECPHVFHKECLLEWLVRKPHCPICRRDYLSKETVACPTATSSSSEDDTPSSSLEEGAAPEEDDVPV